MFSALITALALVQSSQSLWPVLTRTVSVPMDFDGDAIFVDGTVNGKQVKLFLDTGFSGSLLMSNRIKVGEQVGSIVLRDFVSSFRVPRVEIKSLTLGDMKLEALDREVPQWEVSDIGEAYNRHCDGILGWNALAPYVVEFNFEQNKLLFHPSDKVDITKRTPDNSNTFLVEMVPAGPDVVGIEVSLGDYVTTMAFDTGNAFYIAGYREDLVRAGRLSAFEEPRYMTKTMVASGPTDSFDWWAHDFRVGTIPVQHAVWSIHDLPSTEVTSGGTIGIQFIRQFNVTLDYRRRAIWFERIGTKSFEPPPAETGIKAYFDEKRGRWVVFATKKDSPAEAAGIKKGDVILEVGGKDLRSVTRKQLLDLLNGPPGTKVTLRVGREGELKRFELTRKYLINGTPPATLAE